MTENTMQVVISGEGFSAESDAGRTTVVLKGILRLNGMAEYGGIINLLNESLAFSDHGASLVTVDLTELEFLNSSGIAMLSRFVIDARNGGASLRMMASNRVSWQSKSLRNLQRLMPALDLVFI